MKNQLIDQYRKVFDKYTENKLTSDDIILDTKIENFYKTQKPEKLLEIVAFLKDKSISPDSVALADELEKLLASGPIVVEPATVSNSSATILPPDIVSAPAKEIYAYPPGYAKVKAVDETLPIIETGEGKTTPAATSVSAVMPVLAPPPVIVRAPGTIFYIQPEEHVEEHELATLFPMMTDGEFETLKASIKIEQKIPIMMHKGVLMDGRTRLAACRSLGIPAKAIEWSGVGTIEELIIALNINHRTLSSSQRAAFAVKLVAENPAAEKVTARESDAVVNLRRRKLRSVDIAGERVNVSGSYVLAAKKISESNPELYKKLLSGDITITEAKKQSRTPKATPVQPEKILYSVGEAVARLLELIQEKDNPSLGEIAEHSPAAIRKAIEARLNPDTDKASAPGESIDDHAGDAPGFDF